MPAPAFTPVNSWQYSRWIYTISRNHKITEPTGAEKTAVIAFLKVFWNPITETGTRPWLDTAYRQKSVGSGATDRYQCNLDVEPTNVLVELISVVGRDLKKKAIMNNTEKDACNTFIAATGAGRLGTSPEYGSVGGSV